MGLWHFFDSRARRLGILDVKLAQGAAIFLALILVKLYPAILTVDIRWFTLLCIACAIRPVITFFGPPRKADAPAGS